MPIKLPKGFQRRKSSGNALDEVPNPPQPSFRVFERPQSGSKSFDGGTTLKRFNQERPFGDAHLQENDAGEDGRGSINSNNRGSGGTQNSRSSAGGLFDSSSGRYSSSSTLPSASSIEATAEDASRAPPKTPHRPPLPPIPASSSPGFSLRAAGRTFSFGRKAALAAQQNAAHNASLSQQSTSYANIPNVPYTSRPRSMTDTSYASASTATPPKFLDTELNFGSVNEHDGFSSMFDDLGLKEKRLSRHLDNAASQETTGPKAAQPLNHSMYTPPPPLKLDSSRSIITPLYSNESQNSQDGLITASPQEEHSGFRYNNNQPPNTTQTYLDSRTENLSYANSRSNQRLLPREPGGATPHGSRPESALVRDADALLVMDSLNAARKLNRQSYNYEAADLPHQTNQAVERHEASRSPETIKRKAPSTTSTDKDNTRRIPVQLFDGNPETGSNGWRSDSLTTKPVVVEPANSLPEITLLDDVSFREMAKSADEYQNKESSPHKKAPTSKIMTTAQFERYQREKEMSRSKSDASKSEDSDNDSDNYDEEDEAERNRLLVKQRKKQEAHLSVYRQQMMKVTGEQPSELPNPGHRLGVSTGRSTPTLPTIASGNKPNPTGQESEDEDDDIPLGILAAHGFPSKDRPPTRLENGATQIRYTSETYPPPPPASTSGASVTGLPRGNLPPFARNLPRDPYFGASLVNPANRESLAFGSGAAASTYGGSQAAGPRLPPGGLVGVIASEERARAARRGSPNDQGGYGPPGLANGGGIPLPPGVIGAASSAFMPMSPDNHAQLQMNQQMAQLQQMQQMQMQWMQQMMAMQAMGGGQPMPPMPPMMMPPNMNGPPVNGNFLAPPGGMMPSQRPTSMGSQLPQGIPNGFQQQQQRSMSMLNPDVATQWAQRNNRASVAPSMLGGMRSVPGLGQSPGYTPSIAPSERSNIGLAPRYRPVSIAHADDRSQQHRTSTLSSVTAFRGMDGKGSTLKAVSQPALNNAAIKDDDDDDEHGWEEMKKKREKKRTLWRGRKKEDFSDVYFTNNDES